MKLSKNSIFFFSILSGLLVLAACATLPEEGLTPKTEETAIEINAPKLDIFDAASQVFIEHGFSISSSNERLGLIATDYKDVKKTFGSSFVLALFGKEDVEVMLTTSIKSSSTGCTLTILPKGRARKSSRFKSEYDEVKLSKSFLKNVEKIAEEIKDLAEKK